MSSMRLLRPFSDNLCTAMSLATDCLRMSGAFHPGAICQLTLTTTFPREFRHKRSNVCWCMEARHCLTPNPGESSAVRAEVAVVWHELNEVIEALQ
mmetsp:Transcript_102579/g.285832  ORF Transcript_102579/g.285832 Transcript_102579/m.285832 type:complete len:96 (+) Transcript_102579:1484-1771(+)